MSLLRNYILITAFAITTLGSSGCLIVETDSVVVEDDATITCDRFDSYLAYCYPSCAATWDCEYYYDPLDYDTQILLDDCADCLYGQQSTCNDCEVGYAWCTDLLTTYLGQDCGW